MKKILSVVLAVLVSVCFVIPCFAQETEQEPFIAETVYPTNDVVVADIDITKAPYNADPTGTVDCTAVLNNAIYDLHMKGGGTIWLPAGVYLVTGSVNIRPFVTLRGDWADPDIYNGEFGTESMNGAYQFMESKNSKAVIINVGSDGQAHGSDMFVFKGEGDNTVINAMRSTKDGKKGWGTSYWSDGRGVLRL